MNEVENNNLYASPASQVGNSTQSNNRYKIIKLWLVVAFLISNAIYLFLLSNWGSNYILASWGALNVVAAIGLIFSKSWSITLLYLAALQGIARSTYLTYLFVANSSESTDAIILATKLLSLLVWVALWIIAGIFIRNRF